MSFILFVLKLFRKVSLQSVGLSMLMGVFMMSISASAQKYVDIARVTFVNTPENVFDSSTAKTRVREIVSDITIPVPLSERTTLVSGFLYENLYAKISPLIDREISAHTIMLKAGLNITHSERLKATYMFIPKLSSDLKRVGEKDFQWGGTAIFKLKKNENFTWQFGGLFNGELFGPFVVPFLGYYYKSPSDKFEMNVLLPASVDMNYAVHPKMNVGGSFVSFVKSFNLHESLYDRNSIYWVKSTNEIFGYLQMNPTKSLLLQARCGYSIARRFSVYENGDRVDLGIMAFKFGDDRQRLNPYFSDGLIFQLRLIYRFHLS